MLRDKIAYYGAGLSPLILDRLGVTKADFAPIEHAMMTERDEIYVTFDGQAGYQLEAGDEVRIRCAERRVRLLRPSSRSYFEVLRQKLKWNER